MISLAFERAPLAAWHRALMMYAAGKQLVKAQKVGNVCFWIGKPTLGTSRKHDTSLILAAVVSKTPRRRSRSPRASNASGNPLPDRGGWRGKVHRCRCSRDLTALTGTCHRRGSSNRRAHIKRRRSECVRLRKPLAASIMDKIHILMLRCVFKAAKRLPRISLSLTRMVAGAG